MVCEDCKKVLKERGKQVVEECFGVFEPPKICAIKKKVSLNVKLRKRLMA